MACFGLKKFSPIWRGVLLVLGGLVVAVLVGWALWCVPQWQVEQVRGRRCDPDAVRFANLEDNYRRTLSQIVGGLAVLYGLYLTYRRIVATEKNVEVAQEGQVTERFTRAIDQLGQEGERKMAIRLGGIYALERIAKDSEKDHGPVMEVLTAYVRENAPAQERDPAEERTRLPTADIQAILTVIGRRETTGNNRRHDPLDLTSTQLDGADLHGANLVGIRLDFANLVEADLREADLCKTDLTRADLDHADLRGAKNLTEEQVREARNFEYAFLPKHLAHLQAPRPF